MRSTISADPKRRPRKTSLAALLALCALAAGVQALAPASAGATANQLTDCKPTDTGIRGYGLDGAGNLCFLGGGEVIEVDAGPCYPRSLCLPSPLYAGGGGGGEDGSGDGSGRSKGIPAREGESSRRDRRKERRDARTPQERELRKAMCSLIRIWIKQVWAHAPKDHRDLLEYQRERKLSIKGMHPGDMEGPPKPELSIPFFPKEPPSPPIPPFRGDHSKERALPALDSFERQLGHIENSSKAADCGFFAIEIEDDDED